MKALASSGTGKADAVESSFSQRRGWPGGLGQMCREGLLARWEPGMQCKGAGQPWEELNTGSCHGQEESKGASGHIGWEVSRPPVATSSAQPFPATGGLGAEGTRKEVAFLRLLSHIPEGLCSNLISPAPQQPEAGLPQLVGLEQSDEVPWGTIQNFL